jgi:outer membrane protein assembly factor BamB
MMTMLYWRWLRGGVLALVVLVAAGDCALAEDWPQWRGPRRDGTWQEQGLIDKFSSSELTAVWRVPVGAGYSGPTVAAGRLFLTDKVTEPKQMERVHCWDERTGKRLWSFEYECRYTIDYSLGPRASVTIDGNRAFALGAVGHLHCFQADSGQLLWKHDCQNEYKINMPGWGIAAAPLIYQDLVIVHIGGEGATLVAFRKENGEEVWRAMNDRGQYSAPILIQQAGHSVVVCWTGDSVAGLDPGTGKVHWRHELRPKQMPIGVATPVLQGDRIFVTSFYDGSLMLRLKQDTLGVEPLWRRVGANERKTDALHSIISTPVFAGDYLYGVDSYGEMRCLRASDGERVWENLSAVPKVRWGTIHFVVNGERVWMFNERGELIIATLSPGGFTEISRTKLITPTPSDVPRDRQGAGVCWAHPAFANGHVFARNDEELVCASLLTTGQPGK